MNRISTGKQEERHSADLPVTTPHQLDPVSTVESAVREALASSASKMGLGNVGAVISHMKEGSSMAFNYYNYNIAKQLAEVLGSWDTEIRAVYTHDYEGATPEEAGLEDAPSSSLIHMIIWAERKTKALDALLETIDHAMVRHHKQMLGLSRLRHVLDAQVVDDEDVRSRTGYAVLLRSIYEPPIQIWRSSGPGIQG